MSEHPIKKPKEKQVNKTQSSSHFFKDTVTKSGKKRKDLPHVEIGVPDPIEEQQKVLGRPTPCTVLAVSTTLFILILLIISLGELGLHDESAFKWVSNPNKTHRNQTELPCQTMECVKYSAELLESMNSSIKPCDNFHEHVCAGYTPKKRNFEKLLKLTMSKSSSDHNKAVKIVRKMLSKCALEESKERNHMEQLGSIIPFDLPFPILFINWTPSNSSDDNNSTLDRDVLSRILIHITRRTPEDSGVFGVTPSTDSEFSLFVIKPNSPSLTLYQFRNVLDILKRHLPDDISNSTRFSEKEDQKQLNEVLKLQETLEEVGFEARRELVTLESLQKKMPVIDWKTIIESWYTPNGTNTLIDKVFGFNTSYYEKVNHILESTSSETLYNFLFLRFAFIFLRSELSSELEETCLFQISQTIPGKIVLHGTAEPKATDLFDTMRQTIHAHMRNSLSKMRWMEPSGIDTAIKKLGNTKTFFGFYGEELIDEIIISPVSSYSLTLFQVLEWQSTNMFRTIAESTVSIFLNTDVFYATTKNEITISRSLLHYPYISPRLPSYINFATVASKIIPQLIHIFDERGRFYNERGKEKDWWKEKSDLNFRIILKCFDETMQNVFGVSVILGWNAYDSTREPYATLPGMNKTDDSLFFYSLVKTMCNSDPIQVNSALSNVPEFNEALKCGNNTMMNPHNKCKMAE